MDKFNLRRTGNVETLTGMFKGKSISVDTFRDATGSVTSKTFTINTPNSQQIINKVKNPNGRFDRLA